ncbi:hypothetical protein H696_00725 [Fonticula alba]|uniref:Uncharacterized protein n=1 Tax=Fonticula alba TaxID=691883 RepID=A0A058ZI31_FONAL|nr:hypothetical protein H696_00725 [Fonticula alba]KCV73182.1 hypothetical protein H696_00725 [Fonticula alba]|eukprot:XP_009492883.1 hypothetical protein H696_00725 [Fonticula alba]
MLSRVSLFAGRALHVQATAAAAVRPATQPLIARLFSSPAASDSAAQDDWFDNTEDLLMAKFSRSPKITLSVDPNKDLKYKERPLFGKPVLRVPDLPMPLFRQTVVYSDGSSRILLSGSPRRIFRSSNDVTSHPRWQPGTEENVRLLELDQLSAKRTRRNTAQQYATKRAARKKAPRKKK